MNKNKWEYSIGEAERGGEVLGEIEFIFVLKFLLSWLLN